MRQDQAIPVSNLETYTTK